MIKIALGSDHAGYILKEEIKKHLLSKDYEIIDFGTDTSKSCDYPDYVIPAAVCVANGKADVGIVFGGSGNGEAIAANKVRFIRCAVCWNEASARLAKEHNNANMIALGGRMIAKDDAIMMVETWLNSSFQADRHLLRINKISEYENGSNH
jgi:ribose 5-phosphate isomerase B